LNNWAEEGREAGQREEGGGETPRGQGKGTRRERRQYHENCRVTSRKAEGEKNETELVSRRKMGRDTEGHSGYKRGEEYELRKSILG